MMVQVEIFLSGEVKEVSTPEAIRMILTGLARLISIKEEEKETPIQTTTDLQGHKVIAIHCVDGMGMEG